MAVVAIRKIMPGPVRLCSPGGTLAIFPVPMLLHPYSHARQRGAALLIVLMLVALATASMLMSALGKPAASPELRTVAALGQARQALIGFAQLNGRLPRPARSATDGRESPAACAVDDDCTGYLPWLALGVAPDDAWGKLWRYSVSPALTQQPVQVGRSEAGKVIRTRDGAVLRDLAGAAGCTRAGQDCVAAVILSTGKRHFGTTSAGITQANGASGNLDEAANAASTNDFIVRPASSEPMVAGGEFDDLLSWLTLDTLYQRMGAAGALPDDGHNRQSSFR